MSAALAYCELHRISQNDLSKKTGINPAYLSNMLKGEFMVQKTAIADRWFLILADFIGYEVNKVYWKTEPTIQFQQIIDALKTAKETGATRLLIGPTGIGKTFAIDRFVKTNPNHTYRITISSLYKLPDLVNELCEMLGVELSPLRTVAATQSVKTRIDRVVEKLVDIKMNGGNPILIIDEGENMEIALLKCLKGLYDRLNEYSAIVVIGTPRLVARMVNPQRNHAMRQGVPELYRRFKAGHKTLSPITNYNIFLDKYVPTDKGLRKLLTEIAGNYGELHDYLEPAIKEADLKGVELNEAFFRMKYDMPKYA